MLASAGIDCRVDAPVSYDLSPEVDALLAWTVREASTNVVRHSGARHARITVTVTGASASAELTDDGAGPGAMETTGAESTTAAIGATGTPGSGLAGLAERAGRLGGTLLAGAGEHGGFRLRVTVPLTRAGLDDQQQPPAVTAGADRRPPEARPAVRQAPSGSVPADRQIPSGPVPSDPPAPAAPVAPAVPAAPDEVPR
jgi:hypothetical protein